MSEPTMQEMVLALRRLGERVLAQGKRIEELEAWVAGCEADAEELEDEEPHKGMGKVYISFGDQRTFMGFN